MNLLSGKKRFALCPVMVMAAFSINAGAVTDYLNSGSLNPGLSSAFIVSKALQQAGLHNRLPVHSDGINWQPFLSDSFFSGTSGEPNQKCLIDVLPSNPQNLLETMANAGKGCVLRLKGEYVFSGQPPVISHQLLSSPPDRRQKGDTLWYAPVLYEEDGHNIDTPLTPPENFRAVRDIQPTATLVIEQGAIILDTEGELHNIGIVDKRPTSGTEAPVIALAQPSEKTIHDRLSQVFFDHPYPLVSDITGGHPYWNHEEVADQTGGTARAVATVLLRSMARNSGGGRRFGSWGGSRRATGSGGGDGRDPYWHWRVAEIKRRSISSSSVSVLESIKSFNSLVLNTAFIIGTAIVFWHFGPYETFVNTPKRLEIAKEDHKNFHEAIEDMYQARKKRLDEMSAKLDREGEE